MVKIRKPFDYIEPEVYTSDMPEETKQSMRDECDLNELVKKYPNMIGYGMNALQSGEFADFTDLTYAPDDLQDALAAVDEVKARFAELPAVVRDRFGSNPMSLLTFLADSSNDEEAVKLGLKIKTDAKAEKLPADAGIDLPATPVPVEAE